MKNYELVAQLLELPAGYDIEFCGSVIKEDEEKSEVLPFCEVVGDIDLDHTNKKITLLA